MKSVKIKYLYLFLFCIVGFILFPAHIVKAESYPFKVFVGSGADVTNKSEGADGSITLGFTNNGWNYGETDWIDFDNVTDFTINIKYPYYNNWLGVVCAYNEEDNINIFFESIAACSDFSRTYSTKNLSGRFKIRFYTNVANQSPGITFYPIEITEGTKTKVPVLPQYVNDPNPVNLYSFVVSVIHQQQSARSFGWEYKSGSFEAFPQNANSITGGGVFASDYLDFSEIDSVEYNCKGFRGSSTQNDYWGGSIYLEKKGDSSVSSRIMVDTVNPPANTGQSLNGIFDTSSINGFYRIVQRTSIEQNSTTKITPVLLSIVPKYSLNYDANNGSGAPASVTAASGNTVTVSGENPTRSGYDFLGWSTSADSTTAEFVGGDTLTITEDTTLYAVWARKTESLNEWQLHSVPKYDVNADGDYIYYNYTTSGYVDPVYHGWTASYWYYKTENFNPKRVEKFKISTSWSSNNGSGSAGGYSYYIIYDADTGNALTSTSSLGTILYENTWTAMPEFDDSVTNVYVRVVTGCSYAAWDGVYASKTLADFRVRGFRTPYIMSDTPATKAYNYQDSLSLSISATGADPLSYQWYENDTAIAGATNPTLNLGVQKGLRYNGSKIYCKITNEFGATTSQTCTLTANVGTFKPLFSASSLTILNFEK